MVLDAQPPLPPQTSLQLAAEASTGPKKVPAATNGGGHAGGTHGSSNSNSSSGDGGDGSSGAWTPSKAAAGGGSRSSSRRRSRTVQRAAQAAAIGSWLSEHFETMADASLPRSTPYDCYLMACRESNTEPLNAASFGKHIRLVFPDVKVRRLGTRGQSRYHYQGVMLRLDSSYRERLPASALGSKRSGGTKRKSDDRAT